jgi:hypothetical protein
MAFKSFLGSSRADMLKPYMWVKGLPVQRTWGWADLGSRSCAAKVNAICYAQCSPQDGGWRCAECRAGVMVQPCG